ncbi:MAG: hypothetical protein EP338_04570 [Bacteroidetes bacterium]|nr:MAG: hypothetical protein EP338_04570 [Bacteroidota bacterium]
MKKAMKLALFLGAFVLTASFSFGQDANLTGKAMSAANDCLQGFAYDGGLKTTTTTHVIGTCPDGSSKYAVTVYKTGHCPQNKQIACLVIAFPVATVFFDCDGEVENVECFNQD